MLTPEYIATMADTLAGMYDELDKAIIEEMTRQIARKGSITTVWENETYRRRVIQNITDDTIKKIAQTTHHTEAEIRRMFKNAVQTSKKLDLKPLIVSGREIDLRLTKAQERALQGALSKTSAEVTNLTGTLGTTAAHKYEQAVNEAYLKVQTGAYSPARAVCDAVLDIARDGNWVMYPSGHRDRIDVATTRAVRTGIAQTCGRITLMDCDDFGCHLVETSAHAGARLSHTYWQGRIFSLDGRGRYPDFYEETGYGEGDGLCGYNCRHSFYPFWEGLSKEAYDRDYLDWAEDEDAHEIDGETYSEYEVSQMLRKDERAIRQTKREIAGLKAAEQAAESPELQAELSTQKIASQARLRQQKEQYEKLCKDTGHYPDTKRTAVYAVKNDNGDILKFDRRRGER